MNASESSYPNSAVAVVGMSGRFPDANSVSQFWQNLLDGAEALTDLSDDELLSAGADAEKIKDPNYVRKASLLKGSEMFDANFFGINAREAELIDPQQRVFLECCWEAIEDAGYICDKYPGSISVYAGAGYNTYLLRHIAGSSVLNDPITAYSAQLGNDKDYLATRVSYKLDLKGAAATVQTACSTSLVAVQRAWQSLVDYECDMALAGGVSIAHPQTAGYLFMDGMILSPDGHCRPFDSNARGTRFSPGAGVVVLKRLSDAIRDRDQIRAVILSASINNDGAGKVGFSAPSVDGQAECIALAQATAGIDSSNIESIGFVEAHGTGTQLGDPIEVTALTQVFAESTDRKQFCALGSGKSNIGHLDVAAGVAGFIKTVLCLENRKIPATINFETPNPQIDFENSPFFVNTKTIDWKSNSHPRRAAVSSFGIGGTNAHAILEEAPAREYSFQFDDDDSNAVTHTLVLSARSKAALSQTASNLADHLDRESHLSLSDVAYTLQTGRKRFEHRQTITANSIGDAISALRGERKTGVTYLDAGNLNDNPPVTFLFSGQGSQYVGMCRDLYNENATFRRYFDECIAALPASFGQDLKSTILGFESGSKVSTDDSSGGNSSGGSSGNSNGSSSSGNNPDTAAANTSNKLTQTSYTQPALFAIEYALARTLIHAGISPTAMMGHSIGEYVAACLAGVMSVSDGMKLVSERGRLMQSMEPGKMVAVPLSEAELAPLVNEPLTIAAINTPELCVVAGPGNAIDSFIESLAKREIEVRPLHTSHAFHSSMMDAAIAPFIEAFKSVNLNTPTIPYISNRTGTWITAEQATSPEYWADHLRHTVRFSEGVTELSRIDGMVFVEVGPGKTLATLTRQSLQGAKNQTINTTPHAMDDTSSSAVFAESIGRLWAAGLEINWDAFYSDDLPYKTSLPTYPFERKKFLLPLRSLGGAGVDSLQNTDSTQSAENHQNSYERPDINQEFIAPSSETEKFLAETWESLLGLASIGSEDNFFELGGHSLLATSLMTRIHQRFDMRLPLRTIFDAPTIKELSLVIDKQSAPPDEGREEIEF